MDNETYTLVLDFGAGIVYLFTCFVLFLLGKLFFQLNNRRVNVSEELVKKDNVAFAICMTGYYFGIVMSIGGALLGPNDWVFEDPFDWYVNIGVLLIHVKDLFLYGILAIILMNISAVINDKIILYRFKNEDEIIRDQNAGTGAILAASYVSTGLIVWGAVSGEGGYLASNVDVWRFELGGLKSALIFWSLGQLVMIVGSLVYAKMTPYDVHGEIERDNVAAGVGFAGALMAVGNLVRIASSGDFVSWEENLFRFGYVVLFGLVLLPVMRLIADKILLPGENLTDEIVNQERPNLGAALIEAFSYIGLSFLIGWAI